MLYLLAHLKKPDIIKTGGSMECKNLIKMQDISLVIRTQPISCKKFRG